MLEIIDNLSVFFEDCYQELGVREYARKMNIAPPTASKMLKEFGKEGLLKMREERNLLLFRVNRESPIFKDLSRIYWKYKLDELTEYLRLELFSKGIVLFGSLSKVEASRESDVDLLVFTSLAKKVSLGKFEKKLKRKIQLFTFESLDKINKELRMNMMNGYTLDGELR